MATYLIARGGASFGPFTVAELREQGISADTMVWSEGMPGWSSASSVLQLALIARPAVLASRPPTRVTVARSATPLGRTGRPVCKICDSGTLIKRRKYRLNGIVALIGYIL